jgi:fucose permease
MAYLTRRYAALMGDGAGPGHTLRRVLQATLAGTVVAVAIMLVSRREEALWIGSLVLGFFLGPIFPTLIAVAEQRTKLSGQSTSIFLVGAGLGGMFVPWGVGIAMQKLGPGALLPAVAANLAILLVLCWTVNSPRSEWDVND